MGKKAGKQKQQQGQQHKKARKEQASATSKKKGSSTAAANKAVERNEEDEEYVELDEEELSRMAREEDDSDDEEDDEDDEEEDIRMFGKVERDEEEDEDEEEEQETRTGKSSNGKSKQPPAKGRQQQQQGGKAEGKGKGKQQKGGKKRRRDDEEEEQEAGMMNVTFEFSDPSERFFGGIRSLLANYLTTGDDQDGDKKQQQGGGGVSDVSGLADVVVSEPGLGTVVHCADETDVFAMAAVLGLQQHKEVAGVKQLVSLLERRCPPSLSGSLRSALSSPGTYVLLHHRFVNLPLPLVPLLHKSLREDLAWAQKNAGLAGVQRLLLLCPCSSSDLSSAKGGSSSLAYAPSDAIYDHFEDDVLLQRASLSFGFKWGRGEGGMVVGLLDDKEHAGSLSEMEQMVQAAA